MSLTAAESEALAERDNLAGNEAVIVEVVMDYLGDMTKYYEVPSANDDRLAKVEAAIIRYIIDSRKQ